MCVQYTHKCEKNVNLEQKNPVPKKNNFLFQKKITLFFKKISAKYIYKKYIKRMYKLKPEKNIFKHKKKPFKKTALNIKREYFYC